MSIAFESGSHIPHRLLHRVITTDSVGEGAIIATHHAELHLLGPPVEGANWLAADGPSNDQENHNRRGVVILDGRAVDSRRYTIDWKQIKDDASFSGDVRDVRSYCFSPPANRCWQSPTAVLSRQEMVFPRMSRDAAMRSTLPCRLRSKPLRETLSPSTLVAGVWNCTYANCL